MTAKRTLTARQGANAARGMVGHRAGGDSPATGKQMASTAPAPQWLTVAALARRLGISRSTLETRAKENPALWGPGPGAGPWRPGKYAPAKVAALEAVLAGAMTEDEAADAWATAQDRMRLAAKGLL